MQAREAQKTSDRNEEDPIEEAWKELLASWDDKAAHVKFLARCEAQGNRKAAGQLYSRIRIEDPAKADTAQTHLNALIAGAWASVPAFSSPRKTRHFSFIRALAMVVAIVLILASGYMIFRMLRG